MSHDFGGGVLCNSRKLRCKIRQLQALRLDAGGLRIVQEDAARFLASRPGSFDIVFLDPPYADQGLDQTIAALIDCGALHEGSLVYVESGGEVAPDGVHLRTV